MVLSRQLGWPIDFIHDESSAAFVLVVPPSPFAASDMLPSSNTLDG